MAGMDAVFVMGTSVGSSPSAETRQGVAVINAAKAARVRHVVYSSAGGADQHTGIPQWESKWRVEQHLRASYVPFTILGPTYFMDNALDEPRLSELRSGTLTRALSEKRSVQQVAVSTVGEFAAWVFERSRHFLGQRIDLASDELSGPDEAQVLSAQLGHAVSYRASDWERLADKGEQGLYAWMATQGFHADLKGLRKDYPEVDWLTYPAWVAKNRAALSLPVPLSTTAG